MSTFEKVEMITCSALIFAGKVLDILAKSNLAKLWAAILTALGAGYSIARAVDSIRGKK